MITVNNIDMSPYVTTFPDGAIQVWNLPDEIINSEKIKIVWMYKDLLDIFVLIQLGALLERPSYKSSLFITYPIFTRQDKEIENDKAFAANCMYPIITNVARHDIQLFHPHSSKFRLFQNGGIGLRIYSIPKELYKNNYDLIIFPDQSAYDRYSCHLHDFDCPFYIIEKKRDAVSGQVTSNTCKFSEYLDTTNLNYKYALILDDLCDGGASFLLILFHTNRCNIKTDLFTAHGVYSNNAVDKLLSAGCNDVMCYRTMDKKYPDNVTVFEIRGIKEHEY